MLDLLFGSCIIWPNGLIACVFSSFMYVYDFGPVCLFVYLLFYRYIYLMGLIMDIRLSDLQENKIVMKTHCPRNCHMDIIYFINVRYKSLQMIHLKTSSVSSKDSLPSRRWTAEHQHQSQAHECDHKTRQRGCSSPTNDVPPGTQPKSVTY